MLDFISESGYDAYSRPLEEEIIDKTDNPIINHPIYLADKYKKNNDGSYHAFEVDDCRISYRVTTLKIKIIRIRHTSRRTINY